MPDDLIRIIAIKIILVSEKVVNGDKVRVILVLRLVETGASILRRIRSRAPIPCDCIYSSIRPIHDKGLCIICVRILVNNYVVVAVACGLSGHLFNNIVICQ